MLPELQERLTAGLSALGIPCTLGQSERLLAFLGLMQKWSRTYNLTAIRDLRAGVDLHLLDSAAVWPFLSGRRILDVGTGAGLPGIPLAILSEDRQFVLLDSSAKKIRFVRHAMMELGLQNVEAVAARLEDYRAEVFDTIMARAFASLADIRAATARLLAPSGRILALKGRLPEGEIASVEAARIHVYRLAVPGVDAERHLVEMAAG